MTLFVIAKCRPGSYDPDFVEHSCKLKNFGFRGSKEYKDHRGHFDPIKVDELRDMLAAPEWSAWELMVA